MTTIENPRRKSSGRARLTLGSEMGGVVASGCLGLAAMLLAGGEAGAQQSGDTPRAEAQIEQIVVTARRREESLQDVPISISAFSSDSIESNMIGGVDEYLSRAPNVSFTSSGARDRKEFSMRGVTSQEGGGAFGMYIDGFNVVEGTRNPAVMDLQRIEVLRGPQGTYFGRNAVGGAINITTMKPQQDWFAEFGLKLGRYSTYELDGVLNAPLIDDTLAVRAAVKYHESDGYIENINPTGGGNDSEYKYGRLSLRYTPVDNLTVDLIGAWSHESVGMREGVPTGVMSRFAASLFGPVADPDGVGFFPQNTNRVNFDRPQEVGTEYYYVMANVNYDFDAFTLTSITGYLSSDQFLLGDIDGSSWDYFYETVPVWNNSTSQEFRLQSTGTNTVDWTVGAILSRDRDGVDQYTWVGDAEIFGLPSGFQISASLGNNETISKAVFGEVVWHVNDRLDLLLGMRYTDEDLDVSETKLAAGGALDYAVTDSTTFDDFSPKVSVSYDVTADMSVYGSIAKGFKAGGVQIGSGFEDTSYAPETLWSYEVGFKSELFDNRAQLNAALFYADWTDMQVPFAVADVDSEGNIIFNVGIQNAAEARNYGLEAEFRALLTDSLTVGLGVGYLDAQFEKFESAFIDGENVDLSGQVTPNSPKWTLNGDAQYDFPVGSYDGFTRLEWYYRDDTLPNLTALVRQEEGFPFVVPSYHHVNLRAGVKNERYSLVAYVENLFDEVYFTNAYQKAFVSGLNVVPSYQTWGIKFTMRTN